MIAELLTAAAMWQTDPPLPVARTEVAGANWRSSVVVVGGFTADGRSSARVDAYNPRLRQWERLPDLPLAVNHAMATAGGGRLYVVGGYATGETGPVRAAFVLDGARWRRLRPLPYARAAGGAAFIANTLYVAGGVGPNGTARSMEAYDVAGKRWRVLGGPRPREHLGVTALSGRLYVVAGRIDGQPLSIVQRWSPGTRRWKQLASVPEARGGTAAGVADGQIVNAGAESAAGTSPIVYAYSPASNRWRRLPDQPTARHGVAVVGVGTTVYVVGGGPSPGLTVTDANESLSLRRR